MRYLSRLLLLTLTFYPVFSEFSGDDFVQQSVGKERVN